MRLDEFKARLDAMSDADFGQFRRDFGGDDGSSRKWYVDNFATSREKWEPKLSVMFGISSEQERVTKATISAAESAAQSAEAAVKSEQHASKANEIAADSNLIATRANRLSYGSMIVAGIALVVSIITALRR